MTDSISSKGKGPMMWIPAKWTSSTPRLDIVVAKVSHSIPFESHQNPYWEIRSEPSFALFWYRQGDPSQLSLSDHRIASQTLETTKSRDEDKDVDFVSTCTRLHKGVSLDESPCGWSTAKKRNSSRGLHSSRQVHHYPRLVLGLPTGKGRW